MQSCLRHNNVLSKAHVKTTFYNAIVINNRNKKVQIETIPLINFATRNYSNKSCYLTYSPAVCLQPSIELLCKLSRFQLLQNYFHY